MTRYRILPTIARTLIGLVVLSPIAIALGNRAPELGGSVMEVLATTFYLLLGPVYAVTGMLIVTRRARNPVGWLLVAMAVGISLAILADVLTPTMPPEQIGPGRLVLLSLSSASWVFFIFPIFHLLLIYPTGRLLSPRWRPLVWLEISMIGFMLFLVFFGERIHVGEGAEGWTVENPIGFVPESALGTPFWVAWTALLLLLTVAGVVSIAVRFRRARGIERQQMKWFLYAVSLFALVYGGAALLTNPEESAVFDLMLALSALGLVLAVAVALLRYRLYEIDRFISRTVSYALVVGVLGLLVAAVAAVAGAQFDTPWLVAATTLAVAALFNPLRKRVQEVVDRHFNRSRYDAGRVMDAFAGSLRDQVDTDQVIDGWVDVVTSTMQPAQIGVWIRS